MSFVKRPPVASGGAGLGMVAASSILFGIVPVFVKEASDRGAEVLPLTIFRLLVMVLLAAGGTALRRISFQVTPRQLAQLAVFGTAGFGLTNLLLSSSYLLVEMGTATICHFIYPVLVMVMMRLFFGEGCQGLKKPALLSALCGVILLAAIGGGGSFLGIVLAVLSGLTYGVYVIAMDKASFRSLDPLLVIFYGGGICLAFLLGYYALDAGDLLALSVPLGAWPAILSSSLMGTAAVLLLCGGIRLLGASTAAFLNMLEPITNTCMDLVIYGVFPSLAGWAGYSLMLLSILLISLENTREEKRVPSR